MKSLVVYDTVYGNTRAVAETVVRELGGESFAVFVSDFKSADLQGVNLLVVGSPILGWQPSEKTAAFLSKLGSGSLKGMQAAAFDTRVTLFIHGDAAGKIAAALAGAGAEIIGQPRGFNVRGRQGPLLKGELEKAAAWAQGLRDLVK